MKTKHNACMLTALGWMKSKHIPCAGFQCYVVTGQRHNYCSYFSNLIWGSEVIAPPWRMITTLITPIPSLLPSLSHSFAKGSMAIRRAEPTAVAHAFSLSPALDMIPDTLQIFCNYEKEKKLRSLKTTSRLFFMWNHFKSFFAYAFVGQSFICL